jgi:thiol-disulfide isomerase/thioredoxin
MKSMGCRALGLALAMSAVAAGAGEELVLNLQVPWSQGDGAEPATERWHEEREGDGFRLVVEEPGRSATLNYPVPVRMDPAWAGGAVLTYRAEGLRMENPDEPVLAFFGRSPRIVPVVMHRDLTIDGNIHTVRVDLAERIAEAGGTVAGLEYIDFRVNAAGDRSGWMELIALRFEPGAAAMPGGGKTAQPVSVRVVDGEGEPMAGVSVILDPHWRNRSVTAATDETGLAVVKSERPDLPGTRQALQIERDGFAGVLFQDLSDVPAGEELVVTLFEGRSIGGRVVDEAGASVAHASGVLWPSGLSDLGRLGRPTYSFPRRIRADIEGRWRSPPLPHADELAVQVRWMQPGYLEDRWGGQYSGELAMADLIEGDAVSILKRGTRLTGQVTDRDGQPVAGALVAQGEDRVCSNDPPATRTDADGRYVFDHNVPDGALTLTVTAAGYAPALAQTTGHPGMAPVDFVLDPPSTFRFRVVDGQGAPLEGVHICPDTWRGCRTLPGRVYTDAEGRATWEGPPDAVEFDIFTMGKLDNRGLVVQPSRGEEDVFEVVLQEPLRVKITATDAESGEPVEAFAVISGILWQPSGQAPHWERSSADVAPGREGNWENTYTYPYPYRAFRIEADGYAAVVTEAVAATAGPVELTVALRPAQAFSCTLVDPGGEPISGATVYLITGQSAPQIRDGRIEHDAGLPHARTGTDGRFEFPPQGDAPFLLMVCHEDGYLEASGETIDATNRTITLQPWATVVGSVRIGTRPGAGERVSVLREERGSSGPRTPHHRIEATADDDGHFRIGRVPPGRISVARVIPLSDTSWTYSDLHKTDVGPGERAEVDIGGTGRPIVGRCIWPAGAEPRDFGSGHHSLSTKVDREAARERVQALLPEGIDGWSIEERQAYAETEAGKEMQARIQEINDEVYGKVRHTSFTIDADGCFRIEHVSPGEYELQIRVRDADTNIRAGLGEEIARHRRDVTVPRLPEGVTYVDDPIDLGELSLELVKPPVAIGQPAPDFAVQVLDPNAEDPAGDETNRFTLSDHRGQVVLVDFWATWCGPCIAEIPRLKAVWEEFGGDPRFAMISLSMDEKPAAPAEYAKKTGIEWVQGFLGKGFSASVAEDYGVQGIPAILLVGPQGDVLDAGLRGDQIRQAVASALHAMPKP